jgi:hypothetical protein
VHDARTVDERRAYLKLAHVWLAAAVAEEMLRPPCRQPFVFKSLRQLERGRRARSQELTMLRSVF